MKITENTLRKFLRKVIKENSHTWLKANDKLLMLDQEGMERSDRENISNYLKAMGMID